MPGHGSRLTTPPLRFMEPGDVFTPAQENRIREIVRSFFHPVVCARCDLRAEAPQVSSCTRSDCPLSAREAA